MVQWVSESLSQQCASVRINANRNLERYQALTGLPVVNDDVDGFAGPLAGMAAGLATCPTPWMVCAPCDSPMLVPDLVARLCQAVAEQDAELAVAHDGQRMQPVFVLLSRDLLPHMQQFLAAGGRKIDAWYGERHTALAAFSDAADMFLNVNTPQQRDALEARLNGGAPP
jgi:molybdenum cofactor guanylyltransferase